MPVTWTPSDYAAWYAAALSTVIALAGAYRFISSGKAKFRAHATFEYSHMIGGGQRHVRIVLRNVGDVETTLQQAAMFSTARKVPAWALRYTWVRVAAGWRPLANAGFSSWPGHRNTTDLLPPNKEIVIAYQPATGEEKIFVEGRVAVAIFDTAGGPRGHFIQLRCG